MLSDLTRHDPHATIAIDVDPGQPVHVSRAELWRRTLQLRADLATAGVGRGDGVVVCLPNWSDVLDWHVATASLGAHVIGLEPGSGVEEMTHVLRRARPKVVALPHGVRPPGMWKSLADATAEAGGTVPTVAVVTGPHGTPPIDPAPYDIGAGAWLPSAATAGMPMPATRGDELAVAFAPSLAAHRESALVRHAAATARAVGLRDDDVLACTRPLSDAVGLSAALAALAGGATYLLEPDGDASTLLDDLARFGVTHLVTDADSLAGLERAWRARPRDRDLATWRWLGVAGTTPTRPESTGWAERDLGVHTTGLYGSAEVLGFAALWPPDASPADRWSPGGRPVSPGIGVRVIDPATDQPCSVGQPGELQVHGYNVVDAVLGDADAVTGRLTGDGWWPTGDAAVATRDGGFHHIGRADSPDHAGR